MNYYNEHDPKAAAWLRELIAAGQIPDGTVDERSITDVRPTDLVGFTQCHFFAGIGGWSLALRLAGWPDDQPVWTGSCPCQPFSDAGLGLGTSDERHLWPAFFGLIRESRPPVVIGEQVASKAALSWLDGVFADLEGAGYACGAADICAAGAGAPHIRQRLYWVADGRLAHSKDDHGRCGERGEEAGAWTHDERGRRLAGSGAACGMADSEQPRLEGQPGHGHDGLGDTDNRREITIRGISGGTRTERAGSIGRVGNAESDDERRERESRASRGRIEQAGGSGAWSNYDIIQCRDGKARRIESGTFPLVARLPAGMVPSGDPSLQEVQATAEGRVMRLKGYGNAIVPALAAEFIAAYLETLR